MSLDDLPTGDKGHPRASSGEAPNADSLRGIGQHRATALFLAFVLAGFVVHLLVHQFNIVKIEGFPLGYYIGAQGAPIVLAILAFWVASRWARSLANSDGDEWVSRILPSSALKTGLAASGEVMSGALVVGLAGVAYTQGYDGLAYGLGLMCGLVAMSLFVAPALSQTPSRSISALLSERYGSRIVTVIGALILGLCLLLLLAAEILVVGGIVARATSIGFPHAIVVAAIATLIGASISIFGRSVLPLALSAGSIAILVVLTIASGLSSWSNFGHMLPLFGYGLALSEISGLERTMLEAGVADPVSLKQHLRPRLHFDAVNFFAIAGSIAFGIAALPLRAIYRSQVDSTGVSKIGDTSANSAGTIAWCAFFVCLIVISLPAVAAFGKLELYKSLTDGVALAALPSWMAPYGKAGLLTICGQSDLGALSVTTACASESGSLTLQDIALHFDMTLLASAEFGGRSSWVVWILGATICFLGVLGGARIARIVSVEFSDTSAALFYPSRVGVPGTRAGHLRFVLVFSVMVICAALIAATSHLNVMTLVAWCLCLAASTLFPAIVGGQLWRRENPAAIGAAMITGVVVWAYYSLGTIFYAPSFALSWQEISNAPDWQLSELALLEQSCRATLSAECAQLSVMAREAANWFGIQNTASAVFAMPAAILVLGGVAAILPRR